MLIRNHARNIQDHEPRRQVVSIELKREARGQLLWFDTNGPSDAVYGLQ